MIDQLSQASFKGVQFPCNVARTTVGRAQIKHRFANSDKNSIEDQGLEPRIYQLTAIITGENVFQDRDALLQKIEEGGPGVLVHPFYGRIESAVARPVSFDETVSSLGRIEIPLTFDLDESDGIPTQSANTASEVTEQKKVVIDAIAADFGDDYEVTTGFLGNFNSAQTQLTDFADSLTANVASVAGIAVDSINDFRAKTDDFRNNINTLIQIPEELGREITGLVDDISSIYEQPEQIFSVASKFTEFGDSFSEVVQTTVGLIERAKNTEALVSSVKGAAVAVAYEAAAEIEFKTVEAINAASLVLEEAYREVIS